jgi:hypothetical protein
MGDSRRQGRMAVPERKLYRVDPNCETWPNTLTENPYYSPKVGPQFGPTLYKFRYNGERAARRKRVPAMW